MWVREREREDVSMWRCEDVKMSRCENEQMWRWEDVKIRRCEDEQMWRWADVKMRRCEDEKMWRWEDVKMSRCEDEQMWRWADVKMRRCEDEKVWRWEDVKMRRCEDEKLRRWEDEIQTPTIGRTLRSDALGNKKVLTDLTVYALDITKLPIKLDASQRNPRKHFRSKWSLRINQPARGGNWGYRLRVAQRQGPPEYPYSPFPTSNS